jgi:hypothetical protein
MACRHHFTQVHINKADGARVRKVLCRAHYKRHMGEDGALEALDEERVTADELSHLLCRHVQTFPVRGTGHGSMAAVGVRAGYGLPT